LCNAFGVIKYCFPLSQGGGHARTTRLSLPWAALCNASGVRHAEPVRTAFSLVELLVVIAVIVILLALLLPAIAESRASARAAECARQLEQIGASLTKADMARVTVAPDQWIVNLAPYLDNASHILHCPDDLLTPGGSPGAKTAESSYGVNSRASRFQSGDSHKIVALDYKLALANVVGPLGTDDWPTTAAPRHRGSLHVLQTDGSVQRRKPDEVDPRICDIHDRMWRPTRDFTLVKPGCTKDVSLLPPQPAGTSTGTGTTTGPLPPCPGLSSTITVSIAAASAGSINEGNAGQTTPVTLTVTLSQAATQTVTVQVVTTDESATVANNDYQALNQTVTFTAGQTSKTVTLNVVGDDVSEPNETLHVELRNLTFGGTACAQLVAGSPVTVTIHNDDSYAPPTDPCTPPGVPQQLAGGLDWLVRHQFDDGSWSLGASTHPDCIGQCTNDPPVWVSNAQGRTAATGLALLPLIGSGSSPSQGPYRAQVCQGINFLMAMQWPNGSLEASIGARASYAHLICHLALAMAYEISKDAIDNHCPDSSSSSGCTVDIVALKNSLELATSYTCSNEYTNPGDGLARYGWRYSFFGDLSHHAWGTAALAIASRSGTNVPATALPHAKSFLDSSSISVPPLITDSGQTIAGQYRYQTGAEGSSNQWTQMGLLCQLYLGVPKSHAAVQQYVNSHMAPDVVDNNYYSYWPLYGNMHGTQLRYFVGGAQWQTWNQAIQAQVLATQSQAGHAKGSFEIPSGRGEQASGGRLAVTVLSLLCLEPHFTGLK